MPQNTLDQGNQLWSSGAVGHLMDVVLPMVIFAVMITVGIRLCRGGVKLVGQAVQDATATEAVTPLEDMEAVNPAGRAQGYTGFDPSIFGPTPDATPAAPTDELETMPRLDPNQP